MSSRIGLIVPFDFAMDREYWRYVPDDVSVHITRTDYVDGPVSLALVEAVSDIHQVTRGTRSLIKIEPDIIAYACTSGSFLHGPAGERRLCEVILQAGGKRAVTTSGALVQAMTILQVRRVALVTPYVDQVAAGLASYVRSAGFEPVSLVNMQLEEGIDAVAGAEVIRTVGVAMRAEADAVFVSCTNLPTIDVIGPMEDQLGVPVLTANQVTMWAALSSFGSRPAEAVADQALFRAGRR